MPWESTTPEEETERDSSTVPRGKGKSNLATADTVPEPERFRQKRDTCQPPEVNQVLRKRYRLDESIGVGGYGVVFSGMDLKLEKRVAIKVLSPQVMASQPDMLARFRREAVAASQVSHEGIVIVSDFDIEGANTAFIVMEYLDGRDLGEELAADGPIEPTRALLIAIQAARALSAAHRAGILHRDLKPANLYLTRSEDRKDFVKIIDFGISKVVHSRAQVVTTGSIVLGTPYYMSPEQARSDEVDHRADIYSLGVILYETLTGRRPFTGESALEVLFKHANDAALPPSQVAPFNGIDAALDAVVLRAMSKDREERYQSMDEFSNALLEYLEQIEPNALTQSLTSWRRPTTGQDLSIPTAAPLADASTIPVRIDSTPKRSSKLPIALVLLGLFVVAVLALGPRLLDKTSAAASSGEDRAATEPVAAAEESPEAVPTETAPTAATPNPTTTVFLHSPVEGATLHGAEGLVGTLPVDVEVPEDGSELFFVVKAPKHQEKRIAVAHSLSPSLEVRLKPQQPISQKRAAPTSRKSPRADKEKKRSKSRKSNDIGVVTEW